MAFRTLSTEGPRSYMHAVRIHQQDGATVLGFTEGVVGMADLPAITGYLTGEGRSAEEIAEGPVPEHSKRFIEVRPPLSDEQIGTLGHLLVQSNFPYMPQGLFVNQYNENGPGRHVAIHY